MALWLLVFLGRLFVTSEALAEFAQALAELTCDLAAAAYAKEQDDDEQ
jgi:hypothetical protein